MTQRDSIHKMLGLSLTKFDRDCCCFSAANESCPQPQTSEHLAAIEIMKLKHILILQNKIDLTTEAQAKEQFGQIQSFVHGTIAESAPIIPGASTSTR